MENEQCLIDNKDENFKFTGMDMYCMIWNAMKNH